MAEYSFTTIWRLAAPIERVYDLIEDVDGWPRWWPSVRGVRRITPDGADGIGGIVELTFRGKLPYLLSFESRVTRRQRPHTMAGTATGELVGSGLWTLSTEGDGTTVRYDWNIATTRRWMNLLAPLPFVRRIFTLNHHAVMRDGLEGARRELGVAGSYERVE